MLTSSSIRSSDNSTPTAVVVKDDEVGGGRMMGKKKAKSKNLDLPKTKEHRKSKGQKYRVHGKTWLLKPRQLADFRLWPMESSSLLLVF